MLGWIHQIAGDYVRQLITLGTTQIRFLAAALIFALPLKKKKGYPLRLLVCFLGWLVLLFGETVLRTKYAGVTTRLPVHMLNLLLSLPMLLFCVEEKPLTILNTWCAGLAAEEIASVAHELLLLSFGLDPSNVLSLFIHLDLDAQMLLFHLFHLGVYLALYVLLGRRRLETTDQKSLKHMTYLVVVSILFIGAISAFTYEYRDESSRLFVAARIYSLVFALVILLIRSGIISQGQARTEISLMERVMAEERKQYEHNRESINLINMRCHDLKHQLANLSGRLTDEEVKSLQEAMNIYDSTIKTGNEVLDVVLYENQLACRKEQIQLTCLANGKALSFMRTRHIYALFSNALRNAMEAVRKLDDPEQKIISIHVEDQGEQVEISVINYYNGEIQQGENGLDTTKNDPNHHGFGTMSMKYIAEQYGGRMGVDARNGIFRLLITLPKPKAEA